MMPARLIRAVVVLLACLFTSGVFAVDVPLLSGRVVDNAELLSVAARDSIAAKLKAHEDSTGNQIAVLIIPSLEGDSVEPYAVRVFETWKLGKKGKDNGTLLLVAPKERKLRIEVGYGLEGTLTDAVTSRIIRNVIAPQFKAGKFDEGLDEGVAAMIGQLEGKGADALPGPVPSAAQSGIKGPNLSLTERILFGVFIFGIIGLFTMIGVATPGMGWFLYVFLIPFWAMFPIVVVGFTATMAILGIYLIGFPLAKILVSRSDWFKQRSLNAPRGGRHSRMDGLNHSSGGWSSGSSSGAGSWSSSDSFSGGGGDSGGGGSSGDY
jgi:uncharacterized protein